MAKIKDLFNRIVDAWHEILCHRLNRHYPPAGGRISSDGYSDESYCLYCGKRILRDPVWGRWFRPDKPEEWL